MRVRSLTERVLLFATLWSAVALVTIALVISTLYRQGAERSFANLLRAQLYNVINSVSIGDDGGLTGRPELGDLRFSQPSTGWYWIVEPLGSFSANPISSTSLGIEKLSVPTLSEAPFDDHYERFYRLTDDEGNELRVAETEVVLNTEGHAARFRVTGNQTVVEDEIRGFSRRLQVALAVFGLGSLLVNGVAILYGLKPLDQARAALEKIRAGGAERLEGSFPREIEPLATEINALIDSNRRIVERARMQVGNLAHSLKTPIAVLLNEARVLKKPHDEVVTSQAEAMQAQVTAYLNRARIAAQRASILSRTEAEPVLERLVRVMRRLSPDIRFDIEVTPPGLVLAMEQQDIEEIVGNLLENAARFAKSCVQVTARIAAPGVTGSDPARRQWIELAVDDDGQGLDPEQIVEALKRGRRLDESRPGTGLGLSIVKEIATEYQGNFGLSRGKAGGLCAKLLLPAVTVEIA
ncbi:MAG: sensor histidine kinase [Allorhizobium sp.]